MDTSSALPAAAAVHLGGVARVPDATLPIDFSPGNPGDFAALLAAQPAPARAQPEAGAARSTAGNAGGRGGSLPDSGKRLPSGAAEPPAGAAAATARREARNAAAADDAEAAAAGDGKDCEAAAGATEGGGDRAARADSADQARQDASAALAMLAQPPAADPTTAAAVADLAPATGASGGEVAGAMPAGDARTADDSAAAPLAAATAALRRDADGAAEVDTPLQRMIAAAHEGGAAAATSGRAVAGAVADLAAAAAESEGDGIASARAAVAALPATATDAATAAAVANTLPDAAEGLRGRHEAKPTAGGAVRLDAPPLPGNSAGTGDATAASGGDPGARPGHREAPPAPLPVATRAAESSGSRGTPAAAVPTAPPPGPSALAATAAMAALRSAAAGGATTGRAGIAAEAALSTVAGLSGAGGDLFAGGASAATPAQGATPLGLLAGLAPPPGSAVNSPRAAVEVQAPPGSPAFADELAGRVGVLVQQDAGGATLKLNPGHLGPVEVRVQVRDGEATVMFAAHHATTREALEGAAPRLRELLAQQGYTQVNVDVAAQGQDLAQRQAAWNQARADGGADREGRGPWRDAPGGTPEAGGVDALRQRAPGARAAGRLDAFA